MLHPLSLCILMMRSLGMFHEYTLPPCQRKDGITILDRRHAALTAARQAFLVAVSWFQLHQSASH